MAILFRVLGIRRANIAIASYGYLVYGSLYPSVKHNHSLLWLSCLWFLVSLGQTQPQPLMAILLMVLGIPRANIAITSYGYLVYGSWYPSGKHSHNLLWLSCLWFLVSLGQTQLQPLKAILFRVLGIPRANIAITSYDYLVQGSWFTCAQRIED